MAEIDKPICEWSKRQLRESFERLREILRNPQYACTKCGRAACDKKWLCKPKSL